MSKMLTEYEERTVEEIARWKAEKPSRIGRSVSNYPQATGQGHGQGRNRGQGSIVVRHGSSRSSTHKRAVTRSCELPA